MGLVERVVYHVDSQDEITVIVKKLKQAAEKQVVFVLPEKPRPFRNEVNIRLLARYARENDKELVLVTSDSLVHKLAEDNGISVVEDLEQVYEEEGTLLTNNSTDARGESRPGSRLRGKKPGRSSALSRLGVAVLALIAVASLWYFLLNPKLTVYIHPDSQSITRRFSVPVRLVTAGEDGVKAEGQALVANPVSAELEAKISVAATGTKREGIVPARGSVVFINEGKSAVRVPEGTIVRTPQGQAFRTVEEVEVPPLQVEYFMDVSVGLKAGRAEVEVVAVDKGEAGNVGAGRVTELATPIDGLKVRNPDRMRGGMDRQYTVVSSEDLARAERMLREQILQQAARALAKGDGQILIPPTLVIDSFTITQAPPAGAELVSFTATATARVTGAVFAEEDLKDLVVEKLQENLSEGFSLTDAVRIGQIGFADDDGELRAQVPVNATITGQIDAKEVLISIAGLALPQAKQVLVESPGIAGVRFNGRVDEVPIWPPWTKVVVADQPR